MTPPRLRLVPPAEPAATPRLTGTPVPADSDDQAPAPLQLVSRAPVSRAPVSRAPVSRAPVSRAPVSRAPVSADSPPPARALAELDALLAREALDDAACEHLAALALQVPGRQRLVAAALARHATAAAVVALRALPPTAPGVLDALLRCFARGLDRARAPVPEDSSHDGAPLLALDFRGSRARGFPDLVARAHAIAARSPAAELAALAVDGRRHYRLTFWTGRSAAAALSAQLRAAHLDLLWLHGRLVRLRGSRLWLGGLRFDADDPLGPAVQVHLLQAWLQHAEQAP